MGMISDLPCRWTSRISSGKSYAVIYPSGTWAKGVRVGQDLRDRGKLDLTEGFIDGTHAGSKKGDLAWEKLAAGRPPRSWQLQTALVFQSPLRLRVLSAMK